MEKSVIERFAALRPEVQPLLILSHSTIRLNLPQLKVVKEHNLDHTFFSDTDHWVGIGKPKSIKHLFKMLTVFILANRDVIKASNG